MDLYQELLGLVDALEGAGLDYALCGGMAVAIPGDPRSTKDIDLLIREQDLPRVLEVAEDKGFKIIGSRIPFQKGTDHERHHLFPKAWLQKNGVSSPRDYNQIANLGLLEWSANIEVSDDAPADYAPRLEQRMNLSPDEAAESYRLHALPEEWWDLDYEDFLHRRRELMARVIEEAFERIR